MATSIGGSFSPGFEDVHDAFAKNLAEGHDSGAAFCAVVGGEVVVDLFGGERDAATGQPWFDRTLVSVFSGSKGLLALCLAILVDRGQLSVDEPIAAYWPEFARNGKAALTLADVLSHRGRLPAVRGPANRDDILDPDDMAVRLADQFREPRHVAAYAYHPLTMGWICAEVIRRVDGRALAQFFAEEIARPLALDIHFGVSPDIEWRIATLEVAPEWLSPSEDRPDTPEARELEMLVRTNPPVFADMTWWNSTKVHASVIPAAGAIASPNSMARLYGCLVEDPTDLGGTLVSDWTLRRFIEERSVGTDMLSGDALRFGLGFALQTEQSEFGPELEAFGHGGIGGSIHGAWPRLQTGFSYGMNRLDSRRSDSRSATLLTALHRSVLRRRPAACD